MGTAAAPIALAGRPLAKQVVAIVTDLAGQPLALVALRRSVVVNVDRLHLRLRRTLQISLFLALAGDGIVRKHRPRTNPAILAAVFGTDAKTTAGTFAG